MNKNDQLLCCYASNNDLWVSLLEKAYMKVNGGYNFPGSNSGIDLYSLTGWIPEDVYITSSFDAEKIWKRMKDGHELHCCLITISSGDMNAKQADSLGISPSHAYAVLDVVQVFGKRLLQVKNPWTKKRWRGKYSPVCV